MTARYAIILGLGTFSLAGCLSPVQQEVDSLVCKRAVVPMDVPPEGFLVAAKPPAQRPPEDPNNKQDKFLKRMEVPGTYKNSNLGTPYTQSSVPGSDAGKIVLPVGFKDLPKKEQERVLDQFFKQSMDVGPDPKPVPGPALSLADLQQMAREHSPLLRQAAGDIQAADGARIQAAVYNNPTLSYASTPISYTSGNVVGPGISETIVTMGKKKLAEAAAKMDLENARLAYRRAETDLMAAVRSNYFAVLVAQEGMRANRGLVELTDEIYKVMVDRLRGGQVAPYEPAQIGVFAGQARIAYIQARNNYLESWKMLATSIGLTMMPVTELSGSVTRELPRFDFEKSLAHVLNNHTDALTAVNGELKARLNLRLQQVTAVPDVTVGAMVYNDNSTPGPPRFVPSLTASIPVPFFDRNQGNIKNAQGALIRAVEQPHATQNALTQAFADAYRRLEENRQILYMYRKQLLPQQVQAFRATVLRHSGAGDFEPLQPGAQSAYFGDLITSEQNLVTLISSYLTTLGNYWQAVSDTASLLQTDDSYLMASQVEQMPDTDLRELLKLSCSHPCSSLQAGHSHSPNVDGKVVSITYRPAEKPVNDVKVVEQGNVRPSEIIRQDRQPSAGQNTQPAGLGMLVPIGEPGTSDQERRTSGASVVFVPPMPATPYPIGERGMSDQDRRMNGASAPGSDSWRGAPQNDGDAVKGETR